MTEINSNYYYHTNKLHIIISSNILLLIVVIKIWFKSNLKFLSVIHIKIWLKVYFNETKMANQKNKYSKLLLGSTSIIALELYFGNLYIILILYAHGRRRKFSDFLKPHSRVLRYEILIYSGFKFLRLILILFEFKIQSWISVETT